MFYNIAVKTAQTVSITLPPEMLKRAHALAKRESRTMSELVREALRHYERRSWWDEANRYGREKAAARGLTERDVERLVHETRSRSSNRRGAKM
jgi:predicted transcriptional regulator